MGIEEFLGSKYKLTTSENFDEYMKELGKFSSFYNIPKIPRWREKGRNRNIDFPLPCDGVFVKKGACKAGLCPRAGAFNANFFLSNIYFKWYNNKEFLINLNKLQLILFLSKPENLRVKYIKENIELVRNIESSLANIFFFLKKLFIRARPLFQAPM